MWVCAAISRKVTVAPSWDTEFSQVYLYGEAIMDCDAFVEIVADEEANGAELVDVTLTTMPTRGNESVGSECGEQVMVLTFRHNPAEQHAQEVGCRWADRWVAP